MAEDLRRDHRQPSATVERTWDYHWQTCPRCERRVRTGMLTERWDGHTDRVRFCAECGGQVPWRTAGR